MDDLNITQRCALRAESIRDANPGCHVICTTDGMYNPMRQVAFGDLHVDFAADLPLIFSDAAEAEKRASDWNARLPEHYRNTLDIRAMPIWPWCDNFIAVMDHAELYGDPDFPTVPPDYDAVEDDYYEEELIGEDAKMPKIQDALIAAMNAGCTARIEKVDNGRGPHVAIMATIGDVDIVELFAGLDGEIHAESYRHWVADLADPRTYSSSGVEMPVRETA